MCNIIPISFTYSKYESSATTNPNVPVAFYVINKDYNFEYSLEKYNKSNETITLFGSTKYMIPYATYITVIWAVVLVAWYLIGLPIGINTLPGVTYGA